MRFWELPSLVAVLAALTSYACSGDHDRLAKQDGGAGAGGEAGAGGMTTTTTGGEGGTGGIVEPAGPPQLTIVNGTVDSAAIRVCFVRYPDGAGSEMPWPESGALDYASGAVADIAAVVPPRSDTEMFVIAGAVGVTSGMSCADLLSAPPPTVVVRSLGVLPASVFSTEKSILLATAGCVGGNGHVHAEQEAICGLGYDFDVPTATLVAGFMSRLTDLSRVPLQFVQASLPIAEAQLRLTPGTGGSAQQIIDEWTVGAILPYPPYFGLSVSQLGSPTQTSIQLYAPNAAGPLISVAWQEAFDNSDLEPNDIEDGVGLAFVAVGPTPGITAGGWWNGFTFTVVRANP